jgi:hypothetical protein
MMLNGTKSKVEKFMARVDAVLDCYRPGGGLGSFWQEIAGGLDSGATNPSGNF